SGNVTSADADELAMWWADARRAGSCTTSEAVDTNGDGCVDIADLQLAGGSPATPAATASVASHAAAPSATSLSLAATTPWVVNTNNDLPDSNIGNGKCVTANGDCSLRAALHEANASPGPDVINFNIPGPGVHTIQLGGPLPTITDGGLTINGYTQPGSQPNTDPLVSNAIIAVEIKGTGSDPANSFDAFKVTSANNRIQGLSIYDVFNHFELFGTGATGNVIAGNFIGSDATSTFVAPPLTEGGSGVTMVSGANHNVVGTPALADRNVIGGTPSTGIRIQHEGTNQNVVQNNLFGLKPHGDAGLPLGFSGVDIQFGAKNNLVGGPGVNERNVISGAPANGVDLSHQVDTTGNRVQNNYIGTTPAGNAIAGFTKNVRGVAFKDGIEGNFVTDNVIGGSKQEALWVRFDFNGQNFVSGNHVGIALDGSAIPNTMHGMFLQGHDFQVTNNQFANNALGGIFLTVEAGDPLSKTIRNRLSGNTFGTNGSGLAIDLAPEGATPNDPGDTAAGANKGLNYPVLDSPATTTSVTGDVCNSCRVEFYKAVSQFGRGVGQKLVGSVTAGANGKFDAVICNVAVGDDIAAIAIDGAGNTSEFSPITHVASEGPKPAPGSCGAAASFVSLQPARILDTRSIGVTVDGQFRGIGALPAGGTL
ncbi:MAG TPA: hypothetical protein VGC84_03660, partial [Ilumatobacteraceae bacterium]